MKFIYRRSISALGLGILIVFGFIFTSLPPASVTLAAPNAAVLIATHTPTRTQSSHTSTPVPRSTSTPVGQTKGIFSFLPYINVPEVVATLLTPTPGPSPTPIPILQGNGDPAINAVGDIAACDPRYVDHTGYLQTAALLQRLDGPILGLGDYVYFSGEPTWFTNCFDPAWGQFKSRIYPAAGNHEYLYPNAAGYFQYFGAAAGNPAVGYYSYNLGAWHIIVLNTNCSSAGALNDCFAGSPQEQWLRADLAAHPNFCTLAYYHHPLYSSGKEGNFWRAHDLVQALIDYHADLIINGHDHSYERFAPQDANGNYDPVNGIPEIIAGTGGKDHSPLIARLPNSLVFDNTSFGVLRVVLHPKGFQFQFIPVAGSAFTDSGSGACH